MSQGGTEVSSVGWASSRWGWGADSPPRTGGRFPLQAVRLRRGQAQPGHLPWEQTPWGSAPCPGLGAELGGGKGPWLGTEGWKGRLGPVVIRCSRGGGPDSSGLRAPLCQGRGCWPWAAGDVPQALRAPHGGHGPGGGPGEPGHEPRRPEPPAARLPAGGVLAPDFLRPRSTGSFPRRRPPPERTCACTAPRASVRARARRRRRRALKAALGARGGSG